MGYENDSRLCSLVESAEEAHRLFYVVNICTAEAVVAQDLTYQS